jgi:transposase
MVVCAKLIVKICKKIDEFASMFSFFFPSSKTCSSCGEKKLDLKLSDRTYHCEKCGVETDRDLKTSLNLEKLAVRNRLTDTTFS